MPIPAPTALRRFRGGCEWADEVVDHRDVGAEGNDLPAVPQWLPTPGCGSANPLWDAGRVDVDVPETSHLPSGGPGGTLNISAHVLGRAHTNGYVATVMTFPDGYRLGSLWPTTGRTSGETWRAWMGGSDGIGHVFTRSATAWSVAQRAWAARRWYDFAAAAPDGVSWTAQMWSAFVRTASHGVMGLHSDRLMTKLTAKQISALQQAGFWLPDQDQTDWLGAGGTPLATAVDDGNAIPVDATRRSAERLHAMYASGWTVEAYRNWSPAQPSSDAAVRLRDFLTATREWDATIADACARMRTKAGRPVDHHPADEVAVAERTGEIASLCLQLGYTPFHVGVMVGEGSFDVEALRTLAALRHSDLAES